MVIIIDRGVQLNLMMSLMLEALPGKCGPQKTAEIMFHDKEHYQQRRPSTYMQHIILYFSHHLFQASIQLFQTRSDRDSNVAFIYGFSI